MLFTRSRLNPVLSPTERWWESRSVFNPAAIEIGDRIALLYRAVGIDGISRLGLAWTLDGESVDERMPLPLYEGEIDDPLVRLGVEDARVVRLDGLYYVTFCKASTARADTPPLSWEPAPFVVRSAIASGPALSALREQSVVLPDINTKDMVLFPERLDGGFAALIRIYPSVYLIRSNDLRTWSDPVRILDPVPDSWQQERVGAGPPPLRTPYGWLVLYHGNEYLIMPGNKRLYRMGLAVLDIDDPTQVRYRHPEPIFSPEEPYEMQGPVGNVVFGTGLVTRGDRAFMYYGAGDGVIGVAWADLESLLDLARQGIEKG